MVHRLEMCVYRCFQGVLPSANYLLKRNSVKSVFLRLRRDRHKDKSLALIACMEASQILIWHVPVCYETVQPMK